MVDILMFVGLIIVVVLVMGGLMVLAGRAISSNDYKHRSNYIIRDENGKPYSMGTSELVYTVLGATNENLDCYLLKSPEGVYWYIFWYSFKTQYPEYSQIGVDKDEAIRFMDRMVETHRVRGN